MLLRRSLVLKTKWTWFRENECATVSPLRGSILSQSLPPQLPQWATVFRPWRDWLTVFSGIHLCALQAVRVVDIERLPFRVEVDGGGSSFAVAVAGVLGASKRKLNFSADCGRIHVDDAGFEIPHGPICLVHIPRVDRSREAVLHTVRDLERFVKGVERKQGNDRAEDFFLGDAHRRIYICKNRGLVEPAIGEPARRSAMSSNNKPRALVLPDLDVLHNSLQLRFVDQRSNFSFWLKAVANFESPHSLRKPVEEFSIHFLVNSHAAGSRAALPARPEPAPHRAFDSEIQVGIVHDEDDILAAHFEM